MDSSIVGYIILGLIGFIILMSILFGLKRGLKKAIFRFVWLVATGAILWILTPTISAWLNGIDISSFGLDINGPVSKLSDIGVNLLNSLNLDDAISQSEAVQSFAENFPTMILNVVVFVLGFWIFKILLYPIWAIIASKCFDKKKRELKAYKRKIKNLKKRGVPVDEDDVPDNLAISGKNRFGGMLVGILTGFVICVATFSPIVGVNTIYQKANANLVTQNEEGEEVPYLPTVIDEGTQAYLNSYENSIASQVVKYSGMEHFSNLAFEKLASVEVGGEKIYLANEVDNGIYLYNKYTAISNFMASKDTCTYDSIADTLSDVKDVLQGLKGSKLIDSLGDDLLPYFVDKYFVKNEDLKIEVDGQDYAELLKIAYKNSTAEEKLKVDKFIDQVEAIIDIATLFNENGLMEPIIKGEVSTTSEMVKILVKNKVNAKKFSGDFVNNLFKVTLLSSEYPTLVDSAVEKVFTGAKIEGYQKKEIKVDDLKQNLKDILENLITYLKFENEKTDGYFEKEDNACDSYGSLGKVVDVARSGILSDSSYNGLINYLKSKASEMLGGTDGESKYSAILDSIDEITVWETEFRSVAPLINTVMKIKNKETDFAFDKILSADYEEKENNDPAELIGTALQKAIDSGSVLITNYNIKETLENLLADMSATLEYLGIVVDTKTVGGESKNVTLRDYMLGQIWTGEKEDGSSQIENWGNEFKYSLRVLRQAMGTLSNFDKTEVSKDGNESFENLGKAIDDAMGNTHLFVENKVLRALINDFLEKNLLAKDGGTKTEIDEIMDLIVDNSNTTVKESILNNIYYNGNSHVKKWEDELGILKTFFVADFNSENLVVMGKLLDDISGSNIFSTTEVRVVVCHYIDKESNSFVGEDNNKAALIAKVKANVTKVTSYENEILNLKNLMDTVNGTYLGDTTLGLTENQVKFKKIGRQFDLLSGKATKNDEETTTESKLLTVEVLNDFLKYFVNDSVSSFNSEKEELKYIVTGGEYGKDKNTVNYAGLCANVEEVSSYENEFVSMAKLIDITNNTDASLVQIGETIDNIKSVSVLVPSILNDIVAYYVGQQVPNKYSEAIELIKGKLRPTGSSTPVKITSYKNEFEYMSKVQTLANQSPIKLVRTTEDGPDTLVAGELFNKLAFGKTDSETTAENASELLTQEVVNAILKAIIGEQLTSNTLIDKKLRSKLSITENVNLGITSYENEFKHMDALLTLMKQDDPSTEDLCNALESAQDESILFSGEIIYNILDYYFDKSMSDYTSDDDYKFIAEKIKTKALQVVSKTESGRYKRVFDEATTLKTELSALKNASSYGYETFKTNAVSLGENLDKIATNTDMTTVTSPEIAKSIAKIVFGKMKTVAKEKILASEATGNKDGENIINEILNGEKFVFANHATNNVQKGTCDSATDYYKQIMQEIQTELNKISTT